MDYYYVDENKILRNLPNKKKLKEGRMLCLIGKGIKDISHCIFHDWISTIYLDYNEISDLSLVVFPKNLRILYLKNNKIKNISQHKFLDNLEFLDLSYNEIQDLSLTLFPKNLTCLYLSGCNLTDLSQIKFPPKLTYLHFSNNPIFDISNIIFPKSLTYINYSDCLISILGFSPNYKLPPSTSRLITINIDDEQEHYFNYLKLCKKIRIIQCQVRKWYWNKKRKEKIISEILFKIGCDMDFNHCFLARKAEASFKSY